MTAAQALAFVERHGVVLEAAQRGAIASLAEAVAGEPIRGSWWSHPAGHAIFAATRAVRASPDVLVCRLVQGKVTFVHRRLWPALARLAPRLPATDLAQLCDAHAPSGAHRVEHIPFPDWLPAEVAAAATSLSEADAERLLAACIPAWTVAS